MDTPLSSPAARTAEQAHLVSNALHCLTVYCRLVSATTDIDQPHRFTPFHSSVLPNVTLTDYVFRIVRALLPHSASECVLLVFVLIGRYACATESLPSLMTMHRLVLTALRVVTKVHFDLNRSNKAFALAGGIHPMELAALERYFLQKVDYRVVFYMEDLIYITEALREARHAQSESEMHMLMSIALKLHLKPRSPGDPRPPLSTADTRSESLTPTNSPLVVSLPRAHISSDASYLSLSTRPVALDDSLVTCAAAGRALAAVRALRTAVRSDQV